MKAVDIVARAIIDNVKKDFNNLPMEEREKICRYTSSTQILTICQMLNKDTDLTTERWRKKQREWLKNCVETHEKEFGDI